MVLFVGKRAKKYDRRCAVCGQQVEETETVYRISSGRIRDKEWDEKSEWGYIHRTCFALATKSPDALMAELKRQAAT